MKYVIKKENSDSDGETFEYINTFFDNYKECRKYWVTLLREHFAKHCCVDGKFAGHHFNQLANEWTSIYNWPGAMGGGCPTFAFAYLKSEEDTCGKYYKIEISEINNEK